MSDYTVKRIDAMETFYKGLFRKARAEVEATAFGMSVVELEPNAENYPDHDHTSSGQEEVFVVLRGSGEMDVADDTVALDPETIIRVAPEVKRRIRPGAEGMRVIAIGAVPGAAFAPAGFTELGAPDPLT